MCDFSMTWGKNMAWVRPVTQPAHSLSQSSQNVSLGSRFPPPRSHLCDSAWILCLLWLNALMWLAADNNETCEWGSSPTYFRKNTSDKNSIYIFARSPTLIRPLPFHKRSKFKGNLKLIFLFKTRTCYVCNLSFPVPWLSVQSACVSGSQSKSWALCITMSE